MGYRVCGTTIGLSAIAAYAGILMWSVALYHPSDLYGTALFALALGAATRRRIGWVLAVSLAAGFVWAKHIIIGPVLLLYFGMRREWRLALALGVSAPALAWVGQCVYGATLGPHPIIPGGVLTPEQWLRSLPKSLVYQFAFAGPPLMALTLRWPDVPVALRAAVVAYPTILLLYALQGLFWYGMRSFWVVVPILGAALGSIEERVAEGPTGAELLRQARS